jgi:acyl dehydratase
MRTSDQLPARTFRVRRADLVRYAGASGDFNPIHWSDRVATSVGLPGVIAHGMYTMALVARAVTDWAGDPAAVLDMSVRFARPVVVPDDDEGAAVVVSAKVRSAGDGRAELDLSAVCGSDKVISLARATIRLSG